MRLVLPARVTAMVNLERVEVVEPELNRRAVDGNRWKFSRASPQALRRVC
jgi:hypothetical protein